MIVSLRFVEFSEQLTWNKHHASFQRKAGTTFGKERISKMIPREIVLARDDLMAWIQESIFDLICCRSHLP